jgi:sodium/bile acid cotransporter 7
LLGVLFSPLINQMFFAAPGWHEGIPIAADGAPGLAGLGEMYRRVMMKLGLAMFVPFVSPAVARADVQAVGQGIQ